MDAGNGKGIKPRSCCFDIGAYGALVSWLCRRKTYECFWELSVAE